MRLSLKARSRSGSRTGSRVRIAPTALSEVLVPHMVLQPIVENAVRHGLGQSEEAVTIEVVAISSNASLNLIVSDDGPGLLSPQARALRNRVDEY